jgi:hypothetical protein
MPLVDDLEYRYRPARGCDRGDGRPFGDAVERLVDVPGLRVISASAVIAEIGHDPVSHRRASGVLGAFRPRGQGVRR